MQRGAVANPVADSSVGAVVFRYRPESEVYVSQPRVKRSATLDGGAVFDHQGYAVGDRTIEIRASVTEAEADAVWSMYKAATYLILHVRDGSYYGAVSNLQIDRGEMRLTFLVKEAA
jgi:hypothetical protein